jgi:hypothetical protein
MSKNTLLQCAAILIVAFGSTLLVNSDHCWAQAQSELRQSVEQKYEQYRTAIKNEHQIDIKNFKDRIPGGVADGKPITNYDLQQLLLGIKWESRIQRRKYARDPIQHRTYDLTHASLRDCRTGHAG